MSNELNSEIIFCKADNGQSRIEYRFSGDTLWLSLNQISELFDRNKLVISKHFKNIFEDEKLKRDSVVAQFATTATD